MQPLNIVIDTNYFISALFGGIVKQNVGKILLNNNLNIIISEELRSEIDSTLQKPKVSNKVTTESISALKTVLNKRTILMNPKSKFDICRDPNDNFLLSLCYDAKIDYLITGDSDLLILNPFEKTKIVTLSDFICIIY